MTKSTVKKAWPWLWLSVLIILIDQFTKYLVVQHLEYGQPVKALPFFNFTLSYNPGASFGFLGGQGGWQGHVRRGIRCCEEGHQRRDLRCEKSRR